MRPQACWVNEPWLNGGRDGGADGRERGREGLGTLEWWLKKQTVPWYLGGGDGQAALRDRSGGSYFRNGKQYFMSAAPVCWYFRVLEEDIVLLCGNGIATTPTASSSGVGSIITGWA